MLDTQNHADLNPELPPPASTEHSHESSDMALLSALFIDYLDKKLGGVVASRSSGPGSSPGRGHCLVFLGKTLNSHSASLRSGIYMGTSELLGKPNKFQG